MTRYDSCYGSYIICLSFFSDKIVSLPWVALKPCFQTSLWNSNSKDMLHNSLLKCQAVHVQDNGTSCSTHETVLKNVFIHFEVGKAGISIPHWVRWKWFGNQKKSSRFVCPLVNQFNICWILLYFFLNILPHFKYTMKIGHFFLIHTF